MKPQLFDRLPTFAFPRAPVLSLVATLLATQSVLASETVARAYDIKNVSEVAVGGGGRIQITQGDTESLRVEAAADVIDRVSVDLSGSKLTLGLKRNSGRGWSFFDLFHHQDEEVRYIVQLKDMKYLGLSGASHAVLGDWKGRDLAINVSGAGQINFSTLVIDDLFVELSGASNSNAQSISANKMKFELSGASGASNFRGKLMTATQADVSASGASNIELNATDILKAGASGASNVRYLGNPKLQSNASGASNINSLK